MFEFALARGGIDAAAKVRHEFVGAEAFEDALVPAISVDQEIAVALKVCGETPHAFHELLLFGKVVADRCEARPDFDVIGVSASFESRPLYGLDRILSRFVAEISVKHHFVKSTST